MYPRRTGMARLRWEAGLRPFDSAQGRPFDSAQGRPFEFAQGRPFGCARPELSSYGSYGAIAEICAVSRTGRPSGRTAGLKRISPSISRIRRLYPPSFDGLKLSSVAFPSVSTSKYATSVYGRTFDGTGIGRMVSATTV